MARDRSCAILKIFGPGTALEGVYWLDMHQSRVWRVWLGLGAVLEKCHESRRFPAWFANKLDPLSFEGQWHERGTTPAFPLSRGLLWQYSLRRFTICQESLTTLSHAFIRERGLCELLPHLRPDR
jgi:hypothetical protein